MLALVGGLIMLVRRPAGFETGLAQFALLSLGLAVHLLAPLPQGDYPGAVRLAQMAAFPLLLTLPFRFAIEPGQTGSLAARRGPQADLVLPLLKLASASGSQEICRSLTKAVAQALPANLCVLLSPPDSQKTISVHCGYEVEKKDWLGSATFDGSLVPVLSEALRQSRPLHLPANGNLPDLVGLGQAINRNLSGALLAAPVTSPAGGLLVALVVVSGRDKRSWSAAEQNYLAEIAQALPGMLQRSQERIVLGDDLDQANRSIQRLQAENKRLILALQDAMVKEKSALQEADDLRAQLRTAQHSTAQPQAAGPPSEAPLSVEPPTSSQDLKPD
jgi:hypothetical protein